MHFTLAAAPSSCLPRKKFPRHLKCGCLRGTGTCRLCYR